MTTYLTPTIQISQRRPYKEHYIDSTQLVRNMRTGVNFRWVRPSVSEILISTVHGAREMCIKSIVLQISTFIVSPIVSLTFHFRFIPVSCALLLPHILHLFRGCTPHSIIMFNHDDPMPVPTLIYYKYSRCSKL